MDFLFARFDEIVGYPDFEKAWLPLARKSAERILMNTGVNLILSVSPPIVSHLLARQLKLKYNLPWVAEMSHAWSQNNAYPYSPVRRRIDRRLELKTLNMADEMISVSGPISDKLGRLHGREVHTIYQGFDPVTVNVPPAKLSKKFTLTYTGSLHHIYREPSTLFKALRNLITSGVIDRHDVEVRFYGHEQLWVDIEAQNYGLADIVIQYGQVSVEESIQKQRETQVLLFLMYQDPNEVGAVSSKIFEYLAAMRPILAVGGYSDTPSDLITQTGYGVWAPSVKDVENELEKSYKEYKDNGKVTFHANSSVIDKYNRLELTRKFSEIFENLI